MTYAFAHRCRSLIPRFVLSCNNIFPGTATSQRHWSPSTRAMMLMLMILLNNSKTKRCLNGLQNKRFPYYPLLSTKKRLLPLEWKMDLLPSVIVRNEENHTHKHRNVPSHAEVCVCVSVLLYGWTQFSHPQSLFQLSAADVFDCLQNKVSFFLVFVYR